MAALYGMAGCAPWPAPGSAPQLEAVIVAGGFGTRLLPLTTHRPKHLLEVGGVPFLEHQISRLAAAGRRARRARHVVPRRPVRAGARRRQPLGHPARLRAGGGAARHRRGDPQRGRRARRRPGGRRGDPQRRRALRARPRRPARRLRARRATAGRSTCPCTWSRSRTRVRSAACRPTRRAG